MTNNISIYDMKFRRKFSINPYKNLKLNLGEMSFYKDWINTDRGDPYPAVSYRTNCDNSKCGNFSETVSGGRYTVTNSGECTGEINRVLGQHFPYATYELELSELCGGAGFSIALCEEDGNASTVLNIYAENLPEYNNQLCVCHELILNGTSQGVKRTFSNHIFSSVCSFIVTSRGKFFDVYLKTDKIPEYVLTLDVPEFSNIIKHSVFSSSDASLYIMLSGTLNGTCGYGNSERCAGMAVIESVRFYLDVGISHADMKPIRYEDGTPMITDGRLFMTMSSRLQAGGFQSVISWNPSGCDMRLEGAIFFDCGDDMWCADVASSVLYNRSTNEWYIWACSFSHGHILCHGTSRADLRYGINVIDAELMKAEQISLTKGDELSVQAGADSGCRAELNDDELWLAKTGDEDPDFVFDKERNKWYMTICRCVSEQGQTNYRYFLFESDEPFSGYVFRDKTLTGANTGGSIVRIGEKLHFICGSNFDIRALYNVYDLDDLSKCSHLKCDFDDGGFRGWGTIIPVPCGNRIKYMWMTFDRHCGSTYNWSYGNIYVYESDLMQRL